MIEKHELKTLTLAGETFNSFPDQEAREDIKKMKRGIFAAVSVTDQGKRPNRLMVSFMDDDCRAEVVSKLENLIDQKGVPYTLACAPGDMIDPNKAGRFITPDDLKRMVSKGVTVSCHAYKQYNMDEFDTLDAFREDLEKCRNQFREWGIPVETMSYPQGRTVDAYMPAVREHYRAGFTVKDGINQIPYASYYMNRVGLFENDAADDGTASLANAKAWVNRLADRESGWLVFMTHAWYAGFKPELLGELIDYIRSKGIEIVDIHEALDTTGNIIETGTFKKPSEDLTEPFFVLDAAGVAHTNALTEYSRKLYEFTELEVPYLLPVEGNWYISSASGKPLSHGSDTDRRVSQDIAVSPGEKYRVSCAATWNSLAYVVLRADGSMTEVKQAGDAKAACTIVNREIDIPADGAILRLASNLGYQTGGYKIYKVTYLDGSIDTPVEGDAPTLDAPDDVTRYVLPIAGKELGGVKNGGNVVINEDGTMTAPGGGAWELLCDVTLEEETQSITQTWPDKPMKKVIVTVETLAAAQNTNYMPMTFATNDNGTFVWEVARFYPLALPKTSEKNVTYLAEVLELGENSAITLLEYENGITKPSDQIVGTGNVRYAATFGNSYYSDKVNNQITGCTLQTYGVFAVGTKFTIWGMRK